MGRIAITTSAWQTDMEIEDNLYRGWFVTAAPFSGHWKFKCYDPKGKICTFDKAYRTPSEALSAAKEFVDRDITKCVLSQVLAQWLEVRNIKFEEYLKLLKSVYSATHPASYWD